MPEFYMIFASKMSAFYKLIIGQKYFPRFFGEGGCTCPPPAPVSYAYGLGTCLKLSELGKSCPPPTVQVATPLAPQPPNPGAATAYNQPTFPLSADYDK